MSIISGPLIIKTVERTKRQKLGDVDAFRLPHIDIDPWNPKFVGPNSIDVHLADKLLVYTTIPLSAKADNQTREEIIGPGGFLLNPGTLYLGSTVERTFCAGLVPCLETRSSIARLGISAHLSAGFGDDGYSGSWTLELTCVHQIWIYPGMRIAQISFAALEGERQPYKGKYSGNSGPVASKLWQDERK